MNKPYHIVPVNDVEEHESFSTCHCNPVLKDGVWVHNSFDGREVFEQAAEMIKNTN